MKNTIFCTFLPKNTGKENAKEKNMFCTIMTSRGILQKVPKLPKKYHFESQTLTWRISLFSGGVALGGFANNGPPRLVHIIFKVCLKP